MMMAFPQDSSRRALARVPDLRIPVPVPADPAGRGRDA